jgi:hypothetical protein
MEPSLGPSLACSETSLVIVTDYWASETNWELTSANDGDAVIGSLADQEVTLVSNTQYDFDLGCLATGDCYTFTVFDSFGDGMGGTGFWTLDFDGAQVGSGGGDFGSSEFVSFGGDCNRRLAAAASFHYATTVLDDDSTAELEISVSSAKTIKVVITDIETGEMMAELFNGPVFPESPAKVSFDTGNIFTAKYAATISCEAEGETKTFTLAKVE